MVCVFDFDTKSEPITINKVAKFIGNAVPVRLGTVIGKSIKAHLQKNEK